MLAISPAKAGSTSRQHVDRVEGGALVLGEVAVIGERQALERAAASPTRSPVSRAARPRAISAMSGFFFCGMIEEPVAKASSSVTQPNWREVQSVTSSASRDRFVVSMRRDEQELGDMVARADGIDRVLAGAVIAQRRGAELGMQRDGRAGQRGGAERRLARAPLPVLQPADVAARAPGHAPSAGGRR